MENITLGQWLLLCLWVEEQVMVNVTALRTRDMVEVLSRCFGCMSLLPDNDVDAEDGLCQCCRTSKPWRLN